MDEISTIALGQVPIHVVCFLFTVTSIPGNKFQLDSFEHNVFVITDSFTEGVLVRKCSKIWSSMASPIVYMFWCMNHDFCYVYFVCSILIHLRNFKNDSLYWYWCHFNKLYIYTLYFKVYVMLLNSNIRKYYTCN